MKKEWSGCLLWCIVILMAFYLVWSYRYVEGFEGIQACGVGLPSCHGEHIRCINGYCKSDQAPTLPPFSDLPIRP